MIFENSSLEGIFGRNYELQLSAKMVVDGRFLILTGSHS